MAALPPSVRPRLSARTQALPRESGPLDQPRRGRRATAEGHASAGPPPAVPEPAAAEQEEAPPSGAAPTVAAAVEAAPAAGGPPQRTAPPPLPLMPGASRPSSATVSIGKAEAGADEAEEQERASAVPPAEPPRATADLPTEAPAPEAAAPTSRKSRAYDASVYCGVSAAEEEEGLPGAGEQGPPYWLAQQGRCVNESGSTQLPPGPLLPLSSQQEAAAAWRWQWLSALQWWNWQHAGRTAASLHPFVPVDPNEPLLEVGAGGAVGCCTCT